MNGRGRGRGRGAAPSGPRPVARDDEGNVVEKPLPNLPEEDELNEFKPYVIDYRDLSGHYKHSPFHLRGKDGGRKPAAASNATLASVVTLDPHYFPSELYSEQLKSRGISQAAQAAYWSGHRQQRLQADDADDLTLGRLDELAQKESLRGGLGGMRHGSGGDGALGLTGEAEEDGHGDDDAEADGFGDDEDFVGDEDDPYQQFDDDEGYDDPDDDGDGGNEATYY
ncbi:hypothetical protein KSW81_005586 [Nannochloris sp. 'desiccata']|nr:hypothetical protein KSW81_005586 [Chlorella desiccata (nom. nud.)]